MTDMATTYRPQPDESRERLVSSPQTSSETQTLITEQQVLFSTAAAVALPPAKIRGWVGTAHVVAAAVGDWFASAAQPPKPVYPKRHLWLENALIGREMDRL
ncbi:hypothetical protein GGC64_002680 [Mycobacterium sp. OAS707]|uniref:hypothetical protein n=1 Tax=Mycobacterium sp. OAS707 TaxID=2663822 RepID=UPI00178B6112|nr:hypothetical protein [Mycobacterium sp. OAS707]MBE1548656.1 hypothetical protein [Mycobacterium sp. OAS707]